jgi:hypothetical protein
VIRRPATFRHEACWHSDAVDAERYRIVVAGQLGPRYSDAFNGMTVQPLEENTAIVGQIRDQAHLQGVLERIASLGLRLVSVTAENDRAA